MKFAVIVDAYSTGSQLPRHFAAQGWHSIHMKSTEKIAPFLLASYRPADFVEDLSFNGDFEELLRQVRLVTAGLTPSCVMAGSEIGVEFSDRLAAAWQLPGNSPHTSRSRRDKYEMAMALQRAGLAAPVSLRTNGEVELIRWAQQHDSWPIVLKPLASAGNDSVYFCHDMPEALSAFYAILGTEDRLMAVNDHVLAQHLLKGTQYVVNSVSVDGRHYFSDIWIDRRTILPGASNIYDYEELLPSTGTIQAELCAYVERALDALGIRNGPAHSEVMLTANGPVLIETGARLQGGVIERPILDTIGTSQISLSAERYCDEARFLSRFGQPYPITSHLICVNLVSHTAGTVLDTTGFDAVKALASYHCHSRLPSPGSTLKRTVDYFTIPGIVYLGNSDRAALHRDYEAIRRFEREGRLFRIAEHEAVDA